MEQQTIQISKLEVNKGQIDGLPKNPRFIRDTRFEQLKKSIEDAPEMLNLRELIVMPHGKKYVVIGGNMRLRACTDLGYKELPCKVLPADTPPEKLREYAIKDNNGFGQDDWDLLANEWDEVELGNWGVEFPIDLGASVGDQSGKTADDAEEDDFDENKDNVESRCSTGDLWQLGDHRLLCGDATSIDDVHKLMGGLKADLWLTDPPYNVNVSNSAGLTIQNDNMQDTEFRKFLKLSFKAAKAYLANGAPFYIWFASKEHINFEGALSDNGMKVRQELIWNKKHFILGRSHYQYKHEPCLYGWIGESCKYFINWRDRATVIEDEAQINIDKMKAAEMRDLLHRIYDSHTPTTILDEKKPNVNDLHPTMKPVRLFAYLMENSSKPGDIVLDTFGGSGTTMIVAEQMVRRCCMMELDPHYCDVIIARWEKLTGRKAEMLTSKQ